MASIPTATDVRTYLDGFGISATDPTDAWITNRINNWCVPLIERLTGFSLSAEETVSRYFSGTGSKVLLLDSKNIVSVETVQFVGIDPDDPVTSVSTYTFIQEQGILRSTGTGFPKGDKNIKVTYKIGYAPPNIPEDLYELILIMMADKILGREVGKSGGGSSLSVVAYSTGYGKKGKYSEYRADFARDAQSILRKYTSAVVGG